LQTQKKGGNSSCKKEEKESRPVQEAFVTEMEGALLVITFIFA
jgi:hypothetical protein